MTPLQYNEELLTFFKALSEPNRLKIVGLLSQQDLSVEQIAEMIGTSASTASHHLTRLAKAGLVSARSESYYNIYHLEADAIEDMSRRLLAKDALPSVAADLDMDAYDKKVIKNYSNPDGTLKAIPFQQKKMLAVLRYVLRDIEKDVHYTEQQINDILEKYNEDYPRMRREMVDFGFLNRTNNGSEYWRTDKE